MPDLQLRNHASFIWSVADKLRGVYKQSEYGRVILPLVVVRRLDCVLERTKADVLARHEALKGRVENVAPVLESVAGVQFYNTSPLDFRRLLDDPANVAGNLRSFIAGFSPAARDVIEKFGFDAQITRLERANLLYLVVSQFAEVDLHPDVVSNLEMGYLYEELVRKFSELSNETAGEHFTPREVIRFMVNLLFVEDDDLLHKPGIVKTLFDPACGTGGMLSVAEDHLRELNPDARLEVFGQELNEETYAVCRSDMMLKGQDASHIVQGNSFDDDGHAGRTFDYLLANPPFGVEWKSVQKFVTNERERDGLHGRFGAGLPAINDGSFLFLQHMISKMKPASQGGSRVAIVFNGSPLFTGAAGSGPSEIRRWIIENDWLEAVVALPDQLFYNTGISTYFWVVTNRKSAERRGKVQLVDARELWVKMRKSLGEKRKAISAEQIEEITRLYGAFEENERVKIFRNQEFGYQRITVERPLRLRYAGGVEARERLEASKAFAKLGEEQREGLRGLVAALRDLSTTDRPEALAAAAAVNGKLPKPEEKALLEALSVRDPDAPALAEPDPELRDQENVPLPTEPVVFEPDVSPRLASGGYRRAVDDYMAAEVLPYVAGRPKQRRAKADVSSGYTRFCEDDVLVPKITPTFEAGRSVVAKGLATSVAAGTTELHVVRAHGADSRYLNYVFQSKPFLAGGEASMVGVAGQKRVPEEWLLNYPISIDDRRLQFRIADFLDAETARIDAVVEKKRRLIALLEERTTLLLARALEAHGFRWGTSLSRPEAGRELPPDWQVCHLSVVLDQLTNGYVGPTRDVLVERGVKYIQSLHIKNGTIDFTRRPFYVPLDWHAERPRIHLRPGDVLIVQTGDIGQVAVVPPDFGPASCHALQILRVRRDLLTGDYLGAYLRSPFGRESLLSRVTGALHPHLEGGIRDVPIVVPPLAVQGAVVMKIAKERAALDAPRSRVVRQIDLLREHRQALITAAVTGQLEIAKAAA